MWAAVTWLASSGCSVLCCTAVLYSCAVQCCTTFLCCAVRLSCAVLCCFTVLCCTAVLCSAVMCGAGLRCGVRCCAVLCGAVLCCAVLRCVVLKNVALLTAEAWCACWHARGAMQINCSIGSPDPGRKEHAVLRSAMLCHSWVCTTPAMRYKLVYHNQCSTVE